jgi:hypothetical protein
MKEKLIYLMAGLLIYVTPVVGQNLRLNIKEGTKMTVSGTSTLHDWTSDVNEVRGFVSVKPEILTEDKIKKSDKILDITIVVPVKSIISSRGSIMDEKTWRALKSDDHPDIKFNLVSSKLKPLSDNTFTVIARGNVEIAGIRREIEMQVDGKRLDSSTFIFEGKQKINMKDYDMEPPTAMFGQIVTGEEVEIAFKLIVGKE